MSDWTDQDGGAVLFTTNLDGLARFYGQVAGMRVVHAEDDHVALARGAFRLVVHRIPDRYAREIAITVPPTVRERSAAKLVFRVDDIGRAREAAGALGGAVYGPDREWRYRGALVCDGHDPDGNVFQLVARDGSS